MRCDTQSFDSSKWLQLQSGAVDILETRKTILGAGETLYRINTFGGIAFYESYSNIFEYLEKDYLSMIKTLKWRIRQYFTTCEEEQ